MDLTSMKIEPCEPVYSPEVAEMRDMALAMLADYDELMRRAITEPFTKFIEAREDEPTGALARERYEEYRLTEEQWRKGREVMMKPLILAENVTPRRHVLYLADPLPIVNAG